MDELTDEEDIDDDLVNTTSANSGDIVGTFELHIDDVNYSYNQPENDSDDSDNEPLACKIRRLSTACQKTIIENVPEWEKGATILSSQPVSKELHNIEQLKNELEGKSPLEIFFLYFDDELLDLVVGYSLKYARDNNRHQFDFDRTDLLAFLGILILSGYHTLPQMQLYWSNDDDKGLDIIKKCMSRNRFYAIKKNLHLSDNTALDKSDKFAKLRPFFDAVNKRNLQFGVFSFCLSIDEQMVPYFGRHSCKMYIKGKPVRFGFKQWCICSSDGYVYKFIPYAGATPKKEKSNLGMGGEVVVELLSIVDDPGNHEVYFDNFFSSYKLLLSLQKKGFYATGTVRENRTNHCPFEPLKSMSKKPRGTYDEFFDKTTNMSLVRWNDNSVVTVISNHLNSQPVSTTKRYSRKEKKEINIEQPNVIKYYNKNMGGVDLHDNGIANYRIAITGKKWWWPLFINTLDSIIVNSWKIYNMVNSNKMSQLNFKSYIALRLLKLSNNKSKPSSSTVPTEVRYNNIGHIVTKSDNNARRRCKICHNHTVFLCKMCNVHLHTDCFDSYHKK